MDTNGLTHALDNIGNFDCHVLKSKTALFIAMWEEARTRFSNQLYHVTEADFRRRLLVPCSIGFRIRHMADVELLFAKNVFGEQEVKVIAKTVIAQKDTGEWTNLGELLEYVDYSFEILRSDIEMQQGTDRETTINAKEFVTKTKAEAFGRIIPRTIHHAGQMAIIKKDGSWHSMDFFHHPF